MGNYVVAIFNYMDGDNRTFLVTANSQEDAAKKAILAQCPEEYRDAEYKKWVKNLGKDLETIIAGAAQGELVISTPFEINSLITLAKGKNNPS